MTGQIYLKALIALKNFDTAIHSNMGVFLNTPLGVAERWEK